MDCINPTSTSRPQVLSAVPANADCHLPVELLFAPSHCRLQSVCCKCIAVKTLSHVIH
ncbi:unnamed protein product, partial [Nesidiocoris tenuis]